MPAKKSPSKTELVNLDESGTRAAEDRRVTKSSVGIERRKSSRRRQIDPTTCERDYTEPEIEFMQAMDDYKQRSGRMFPTCSEILEVLTAMGYRKVACANEISSVGMPSLECDDSSLSGASIEV